MKVIHIAGFSNTGKTTFITELLPELEKLGPAGVIKHIGHHGYSLPEGKDTTRFFTAGAAASAGIDARKSVLLLQENDLERVLELLQPLLGAPVGQEVFNRPLVPPAHPVSEGDGPVSSGVGADRE